MKILSCNFSLSKLFLNSCIFCLSNGNCLQSEAEKDMVNESKEFKQFEDEIKSIENEVIYLSLLTALYYGP